ncbi:uncharacterized protein LOC129719544 [Wyeomyia smithii]|uniref:uncharacterized protein LOC129719544 n=1 Tax=Wyeomyia smithii TaxID=174621 RepID=UPI002467C337|nr:uncharacterized protein LOC129719544 [Wyeomyia smithii]
MSALMTNMTLKPGQEPERITKSSCIYKLTPVLDENGVLRVGGRMETSTDISFDKRFPIILPRKHGLTRKIIQFYHEKFGHANRETVVNELRQRFWIPNIRVAIIQVMRQCIWCKVNRCHPLAPMIAPLPVQRVTPHLRPFSSIGIDYLGPIEVAVNRRKEKRWVCVFTCLAIRAVHLEVVHSLSTQSCLMAIRRFNKEHGIPTEIFSDNATCFKGADREMRRIYSECVNTVASATTAWHFNPPAAPHMGGIWERMVRSVKECMKTRDDGRILTDEVLLTVLAEAEDMINARPLTYIPQELAEEEAITPHHFLRGNMTIADMKVDGKVNVAGALRDAYKRSQVVPNRMWERWSKEYLPTINRRAKWYGDQKPLEVNDLVFIVDGKNRKCWTRGIVEQVFQGPDGRIRQANVRTAGGVLRRAVANLAVLEIRDCKSETSGKVTGCYGLGHVNTAGH